MARNNPCLFCKQRRRKCEKEKGSKSCKRCIERNLNCDPFISTYKTISDDLNDIPSTHVVKLYEELRYLEKQIQQLDIELKQQKAVTKKEPSWTINVVNGQFQLASKIESIQEFLLYGKSAIKYLSPFGNTFQTTYIEFKQTSPSLVKEGMQAISRIYKPNSVIPEFKVVSYRPMKHPNDVYLRLVDNYFSCFNDAIPILHEPSYRDHLSNLMDPMSDAVTLAVCAAASILTCRHSILNSAEKRYFGEYFYERANDILLDMFDNPDKAFESLSVISLLQMFFITTLRFEESRKWGTIATILCRNLRDENGDFTQGGPHLPKKTRIKYAMLHRNYAASQCYNEVVDYIINNKSESPKLFKQTTFDILPDESPKIQRIVEVINYIVSLCLHPAFIIVITQSRLMALGEDAQLRFEQIIRFEETVMKWWNNLPEKLKICPDPLHLSNSTIERTTDPMKLLMASYFFTFTLSTQALLAQPKPKEDANSLNDVIKERAAHFAIYSADICLQLAKRMESLNTCCYSPAKLYVCSIDSLMSVIRLNNGPIKSQIDRKLNEYMFELRRVISSDNHVVSETSPFTILSTAPLGEMPSLHELYKDYPLPGEALLFDIVQTTVDRAREFS